MKSAHEYDKGDKGDKGEYVTGNKVRETETSKTRDAGARRENRGGRKRKRRRGHRRCVEVFVPDDPAGSFQISRVRRRPELEDAKKWRETPHASEGERPRNPHDLLPHANRAEGGQRVVLHLTSGEGRGEIIGPRWTDLHDTSQPWVEMFGWEIRPHWNTRTRPLSGVINTGEGAVTWSSRQ